MLEPILLVMLLSTSPPDCEMVRGSDVCDQRVSYSTYPDIGTCERAREKLMDVVPGIVAAKCYDMRDGSPSPNPAAAGSQGL